MCTVVFRMTKLSNCGGEWNIELNLEQLDIRVEINGSYKGVPPTNLHWPFNLYNERVHSKIRECYI